jgi:hypothetical protein
MEQTTSGELPNWLLDISAFYGGKRAFKLEVPFWLNAYPDLLELIDESQKRGEIIAIPTTGDMYYKDGVPQVFNVEILASTWRQLREANRKHARRQITREGKRLHVEAGYNHDVYNANIIDVADEARHHLNRLRTEQDIVVRRGHEMRLQKLKLIKGDELREQYPDLYATIRTALEMVPEAA